MTIENAHIVLFILMHNNFPFAFIPHYLICQPYFSAATPTTTTGLFLRGVNLDEGIAWSPWEEGFIDSVPVGVSNLVSTTHRSSVGSMICEHEG